MIKKLRNEPYASKSGRKLPNGSKEEEKKLPQNRSKSMTLFNRVQNIPSPNILQYAKKNCTWGEQINPIISQLKGMKSHYSKHES
jgi:hypothetical protein